MRRVLIDHARTRGAQKRQGSRQKLKLDEALVAASEQSEDFLCINEALDFQQKYGDRQVFARTIPARIHSAVGAKLGVLGVETLITHAFAFVVLVNFRAV